MRSNLCEDGKRRIQAKVVVQMGRHEILRYALSNRMFQDVEDPLNRFENLNKREIFNLAKATVADRGDSIELAEKIMNEMWTPNHIHRAQEHVEFLFPEVD